MARIFTTLLAPPVNGSATTSAECNAFLAQTIQQIAIARTNLASINSAYQRWHNHCAQPAGGQFSLLDANNATQQIAISLGANAPPAPADAGATIVSGLTVSLASLKDVVLVSTGNCPNAGASFSSSAAAEPSFGSGGSGFATGSISPAAKPTTSVAGLKARRLGRAPRV
ncbi:hypothetical protein DFH06DRAFT_1135499 [Mycena polygramma]|nr:hypothetical protein DFH06DRAFT_1135499 [Mycena polygramma]